MKNKLKPKVVVHWRPISGEPLPLWRKLWARLLINKKEAPPGQLPATDSPTGGAEEDTSHESG